ncbi:unnamed protein product [Paramecium primaurelia]|uniref:Uncharacterized protein n=1 Tax=Paramecium primaurelia TaxID=5886 RepID=A0A8S1N8X4_PARPR|nr:unnamed protein product [Paramecium primaurelia]
MISFQQNTFNNQLNNQMLQYQYLDKTILILKINLNNTVGKQKRIWFMQYKIIEQN